MKKTMIAMLVISLLGCATPQYQPAVAYSEEDQAFCRYEAMKATASAPSGSIAYPYSAANTLANDIQTGIRQGEMMALCLQMRRQSAR